MLIKSALLLSEFGENPGYHTYTNYSSTVCFKIELIGNDQVF